MTIKDLAAQTGYSVGTVSRVLNHQPHVSENAREVILRAAAESGFQLNTNAKQLKQQQGNTILVICKGTVNELFDNLLVSIQARISQTELISLITQILQVAMLLLASTFGSTLSTKHSTIDVILVPPGIGLVIDGTGEELEVLHALAGHDMIATHGVDAGVVHAVHGDGKGRSGEVEHHRVVGLAAHLLCGSP